MKDVNSYMYAPPEGRHTRLLCRECAKFYTCCLECTRSYFCDTHKRYYFFQTKQQLQKNTEEAKGKPKTLEQKTEYQILVDMMTQASLKGLSQIVCQPEMMTKHETLIQVLTDGLILKVENGKLIISWE